MAQQRQNVSDAIRGWIPTAVFVLAAFAGYVKLTEAVKSNAKAIVQQTHALESITDIMLSDTRQEEQIAALRRDLNTTWDLLQAHVDRHDAHGRSN